MKIDNVLINCSVAYLANFVGVICVPAESGGQAWSGLDLFNLVRDKHGSCSHQLEHQSTDGHLREEPVQVGYGKLEGLLSEVELVANLELQRLTYLYFRVFFPSSSGEIYKNVIQKVNLH